jgi:hypothetical protein
LAALIVLDPIISSEFQAKHLEKSAAGFGQQMKMETTYLRGAKIPSESIDFC